MTPRFMVFLILFTCLSAGRLGAQTGRAPDFGTQWVRTHPFTLMGLTRSPQTFDGSEYKGAGLGTVLSWEQNVDVPHAASEANLPWHYQTGQLPWAQIASQFGNYYQQAPGCEGVMVWDEPRRTQMEQVSGIMQAFRQRYPDLLTYSNALPFGATDQDYYGGSPPGGTYAWGQYLRDFVDILHPDVLMFDIYPFRGTGTSGLYFRSLEAIRAVALEAKIPYWTFVQSYEDPATNTRLPSESDLRMQVFSSLAYGFTGIAYFTYDVAFERGLLDPGGVPNQLYYDAAAVNSEVAHLGKPLRFLKSTGVRCVPGGHGPSGSIPNATPNGMTNWSVGAGGDTHITNVSVNLTQASNIGLEKDGLIGFFVDDDQEHYFMLVNLYHGAALSATDATLSFVITFDSSVNSIWRLNRLTGLPEEIVLSGHTLTWTLPGGTGDLFKYDNRNFAGTFSQVSGDFDGDGDVDGADFVVWQTHFPTQSGATLDMGDADGDRDVDGADFVIWQTHFPTTPMAATASVPEPQSLILLSLGFLAALHRSLPCSPFYWSTLLPLGKK